MYLNQLSNLKIAFNTQLKLLCFTSYPLGKKRKGEKFPMLPITRARLLQKYQTWGSDHWEIDVFPSETEH